MRLAALLLASALTAAAQSDKAQILDTVNQLFTAMSNADAAAISSTMTPDAKLISASPDKIAPPISRDAFAQRIAANKSRIVERIWKPTVLLRGPIALLWADYDVYVGGKFAHCGIDSFDLLKTPEGWKISAIQYTSETEHCKPNPLGPPKE